ncbi:hypothetical protein SVAN01_00903 [Stagonosporopsis vannaccii]|nr:hypothetical protein SVAN01_00903 [Stagonosporopsis vannaccii]
MRLLLDLHSLDGRNSLRSWLLGTWQTAEKEAKTSGIMALAVVFGVAMLSVMNAINCCRAKMVTGNEEDMREFVSIVAAQPLLLLFARQQTMQMADHRVSPLDDAKQGQRVVSATRLPPGQEGAQDAGRPRNSARNDGASSLHALTSSLTATLGRSQAAAEPWKRAHHTHRMGARRAAGGAAKGPDSD